MSPAEHTYQVTAIVILSSRPEQFAAQLRRLTRLHWISVPYLTDTQVADFQSLFPSQIVDNEFRE
jgi:hypothetical protein